MHLGRRVAFELSKAGRIRSAGLRFFLAVLSCALFAGPVPRAGAQAADGLTEIARFPSAMTPATRTLELDASARRLFEIGQPRSGRGMRIDAYDLDSLGRVGSIVIPDAHSGFGGRLTAVDAVRHRMFLIYPIRQADDTAVRNALGSNETTVDTTTRTIFAMAVVDTLRFRLLGTRALPDLVVPPLDLTVSNAIGLKAMSYFAPLDRIYLVSQATAGASELAVSNHVVRVHEVDASRLIGSAASPVNWSYPVPQCAMAMAKERPGVVFRSARRDSLYVPCRAGGFGAGTQQPLETPGVVRVNLVRGTGDGDVARFTVEFFPFSGNLQFGFVALDPVSERLFLRVDATATESGVWIFDTVGGSWLGNVVTPGGGAYGIAVDAGQGRLYVLAPPRTQPFFHVPVVMSATRGAEADQGQIYQLRPRVPASQLQPGSPVVDPVRRRLYWGSAEEYMVLADDVPLRAPPGAGDPDANTADIPEAAGTGSNFLGGAQAYGARVKWVGGARGAERNANTLIENFQPPGLPFQQLLPPAPAPGTRDLHFGRVIRATLSNGEATASAVGADRDRENTDVDLVNYTVYLRDRGGPNLVNQRWPYRAVSCTDFGGGQDRRDESASGASVGCKRNDAEVSASALAKPPALSDLGVQPPAGLPQITVAETRSATRQFRDPRRGIVSVAEAEARGIDIAGQAGIGRVVSKSESQAAGRPGTASGTFTRTIEDVWVVRDGQRRQVCTSPCSMEAARDALNFALGARFRIDLPSPDSERVKGTPGGYESLVVRDPFDRANDAALNDEAGIRLEVPAIVITGFADGRSRSRVVVSLAATSAESHYGIYRLARALGPEPFVPRPASVLGERLSSGPIGPAVAPSAGSGPAVVPALFGTEMAQVVRRTFAGVKFFFTSPGQAARAFGLWAFLAAPLLLLMRRRPS